jgi:hypothetical protein
VVSLTALKRGKYLATPSFPFASCDNEIYKDSEDSATLCLHDVQPRKPPCYHLLLILVFPPASGDLTPF